jgi:alpha-N-arabinofuranosidase
MRAVDPTIKLIAVGDNNMNWNRTVLRAAGASIDYLAIHHYYGRHEARNDPMNLMARPLYFEGFYRDVGQLLRELGLEGRVKLAINEWGLDLQTEQQYSIDSALYGARLMNVFERSGALVEMSAVSDLVNGWPGGIIQAGRHNVFVTPIYQVNQLYNTHRGEVRVGTSVDSPTFNTSREGTNVPYLDATASRTGNTIFIKAVNTNPTNPLTTTIALRGSSPVGPAEIKTLTDNIETRTIPTGNQFTVTLPKKSVSIITIKIR